MSETQAITSVPNRKLTREQLAFVATPAGTELQPIVRSLHAEVVNASSVWRHDGPFSLAHERAKQSEPRAWARSSQRTTVAPRFHNPRFCQSGSKRQRLPLAWLRFGCMRFNRPSRPTTNGLQTQSCATLTWC